VQKRNDTTLLFAAGVATTQKAQRLDPVRIIRYRDKNGDGGYAVENSDGRVLRIEGDIIPVTRSRFQLT
jgi:hypothetical protein